MSRLRAIGFPLNLWVGSQVGLRIGTQILPSTSKLKLKDTAFLSFPDYDPVNLIAALSRFIGFQL